MPARMKWTGPTGAWRPPRSLTPRYVAADAAATGEARTQCQLHAPPPPRPAAGAADGARQGARSPSNDRGGDRVRQAGRGGGARKEPARHPAGAGRVRLSRAALRGGGAAAHHLLARAAVRRDALAGQDHVPDVRGGGRPGAGDGAAAGAGVRPGVPGAVCARPSDRAPAVGVALASCSHCGQAVRCGSGWGGGIGMGAGGGS